ALSAFLAATASLSDIGAKVTSAYRASTKLPEGRRTKMRERSRGSYFISNLPLQRPTSASARRTNSGYCSNGSRQGEACARPPARRRSKTSFDPAADEALSRIRALAIPRAAVAAMLNGSSDDTVLRFPELYNVRVRAASARHAAWSRI